MRGRAKQFYKYLKNKNFGDFVLETLGAQRELRRRISAAISACAEISAERGLSLLFEKKEKG